MKLLFSFLLLCITLCRVEANVKGVFAHFMLSNTAGYTPDIWRDDFTKAQAAHIDAFVLNMGFNESTSGTQLDSAFATALSMGFKLFISFDYAGNGLWPKADVIAMINRFSSNGAYYRRGTQMLVSTFEGPAAAADWTDIKAQTGCFFIPSWSSLGAGDAIKKGTADGLFSWAAWPTGPNDMTTFTDSSYLDALGSKPYMMGVSPWFYTNMPGFRKNWLWRGDMLWIDRWINAMFLQPEYVEIITWNDFGESHHIGPLRDISYEAFGSDRGKSPLNYALNKPHDGWRLLLPYLIDYTKTNKTSFNQELLVAWYRTTPSSACGTGGTTGNTASQLQDLYKPAQLLSDKIFFSAILGTTSSISVNVGGTVVPATWTHIPSNGVGLHRGSVAYGGASGNVVITVGSLTINGQPILSSCPDGIGNFNPTVEYAQGGVTAAKTPVGLDQSGCTSGFGDARYEKLCEIGCKYDYCPRGSCTCTSIGTKIPRPAAKNVFACPAPGKDTTYLGLCSFSCNYGYCPDSCKISTSDQCIAPLPTAPPVPKCISGMADGPYADLCSLSCSFGFCPPEICSCTLAGTTLPPLPPTTGMIGTPRGKIDYDLCAWTCRYGTCPIDLCKCSGTGCPGSPTGFPDTGTMPIVAHFLQNSLDDGLLMKNLNAQGPEGCSRVDECTIQVVKAPWSTSGVEAASACPGGQVKIGYDHAGCRQDEGKSLCCNPNSGFSKEKCIWRGDGGDCNGQCWESEMTVIGSSWGGAPSLGNLKKCGRGYKTFCCEAPDYHMITDTCRWTDCVSTCDPDTEVKLMTRADQRCIAGTASNDYCCKNTDAAPSLLRDCLWRSGKDCKDAKCAADEVTIDLDQFGDSKSGCAWGRQKAACCKASIPEPPPESPENDTCRVDICAEGPIYPGQCDDEEGGDSELARRSDEVGIFPRVRSNRPVTLYLGIRGAPDYVSKIVETAEQVNYKQLVTVLKRASIKAISFTVATACTSLELVNNEVTQQRDIAKPMSLEHGIELVMAAIFINQLTKSKLPSGKDTKYAALPIDLLRTIFFDDDPVNGPLVPNNQIQLRTNTPVGRSPILHLLHAFGDIVNINNLFYLDEGVNHASGRWAPLQSILNPEIPNQWEDLVTAGVDDPNKAKKWITLLRDGVGALVYMHDPDAEAYRNKIAADVSWTLEKIDQNLPTNLPYYNFAYRWSEFLPDHRAVVSANAYNILLDMINRATDIVLDGSFGDFLSFETIVWMAELEMLRVKVKLYKPA